VRELGLQVQWLLETHVHADHLSAAPYLQQHLGGQLAIGAHITTVQNTFGKLFNAGTEFARDGSQFDRLLADGEHFAIGGLQVQAMHTPGHTPACMTYVVRDHSTDPIRTVAFVGDTLFMPDYGTARCDFPGGMRQHAVPSIQKVLALPDDTELRLCHDYPPDGREPQCTDHGGANRRPPMCTCTRAWARPSSCRCASARRDPGHAGADPAFGAGEHARGADATRRGQWRRLPENPRQRCLT
jgi:glyoxylase-like metal-dependent hydrolase (beta-lactamase superfamily II)